MTNNRLNLPKNEGEIGSIELQANSSSTYEDLKKHLNNIKQVLSNSPTPEEIKSAREFISKLVTLKNIKETNKSQNKEKSQINLGNLKDEMEIYSEVKDKLSELIFELNEDDAILNYLLLNKKEYKDINLLSAINVVLKVEGTDYKDWKEAGYIPDGIFGAMELSQLNKLKEQIDKSKLDKLKELKGKGIKVKDVRNTSTVLDTSSEDDVLRVLFDKNSDDIIDNKDNGVNNLDEIYKQVSALNDKDLNKVIKNIGIHMGRKDILNKRTLLEALRKEPELKYEFLNKLQILTSGGKNSAFVTDVLEHGNEAINKSLKTKTELEKKYKLLFDALSNEADKKYELSLSSLKQKINSIPESENKEKYNQLLQILESESTKKDFLDRIKINGAGIFLNLVETHYGAGAGTSLSYEDFNKFLSEKTNDTVKSLNVDIGIGTFGGKIMPGIGASFDISKTIDHNNESGEQTGESKVFGKVGVFNFIPGIFLGASNQINFDDVKKAGFVDFNEEAKYVGCHANASLIGWGVGLQYNKEKLSAINQKEKQFKKFIGTIFSTKGVESLNSSGYKDLMNQELSKLDLTTEDKKYAQEVINSTYKLLEEQGFDKMDTELKTRFINGISTAYSVKWKEEVLIKAQEQGWEWSGAGIGLQFLSGYLPIPYLGASWTKVNMKYEQDIESALYAGLKNLDFKAQKLKQREPKREELRLGNIETGLKFKENIYIFTNLAQNHPEDWKKFIKSDTTPEKLRLIKKILNDDRRLKKDIFAKSLLAKIDDLEKLNNDESNKELNYIIGQFMNATFKDKRSIEEVILGFTLDKNGKYEGTFDFLTSRKKAIKEFAQKSELSPDFSNKTGELYANIKNSFNENEINALLGKTTKSGEKQEIEQKPDPKLFGFVASYKISNKQESLGRAMVEIPAGVATIAGGQEIPITNEVDKNYTIERFLKSPYGINAQKSIENILKTTLTKEQFKELLQKGESQVNGKNVKLDTDFIYFLYGVCANESMGLRIKSITTEGSEVKFDGIFPNGRLMDGVNKPIGDKKDVIVGFGIGDKKEEEPTGGGGGTGTKTSVPGLGGGEEGTNQNDG
ncbi:hypothetical protein M0P65_00475 [Candidatus Gracilibacteria bacterium]|nr:hypothetical protein [Candidatus Gracilibacteria bacterium]